MKQSEFCKLLHNSVQCRIVFGLVFLIGIIFGSGCGRGKTDLESTSSRKWKMFANVECGFQIRFPSDPKISKDTYTTAGKTVEIFQFTSEPDSQTAYGISVATIPIEKEFSLEEIEILLNSGRDKALQTEGKPKLLREQRITSGENPGREFEIETYNGKLFMKVREYLVGKRVYTLTTAAPLQENRDASRFFESFSLLHDPAVN